METAPLLPNFNDRCTFGLWDFTGCKNKIIHKHLALRAHEGRKRLHGSSTSGIGSPDPATKRAGMAAADLYDCYALAAIGIYAGIAAIWGTLLGATWEPAGWKFAIAPAIFLSVAAYYRIRRPSELPIRQILLYAGLWCALPLAGTQVTMLAATLPFPLQDELYTAIDQSLGFSWHEWAAFMTAHPALAKVTNLAYQFGAFQPYIAIVIIALVGPRSRNANFFLATVVALTITIIVSTLLPALTPGHALGLPSDASDTTLQLRSGGVTGLPYIGIVCFPSFHTAMALIYVFVYRGLRVPLVVSAIINSVMLISVPYSGDHYLVDLVGGLIVAVLAQQFADRVTAEMKNRPPFRSLSPATDR